jgi:hypothetical protein
MNLSPVSGYVLMLIGVGCFRFSRTSYLIKMSNRVELKKDTRAELRTALWAYLLPLGGFALSAFFAANASGEAIGGAGLLAGALAIIAFLGSIYISQDFFFSRLIVTPEKLIYVSGKKRQEIDASEILRVRIAPATFHIGLRWQNHVALPSTFGRAEIALAFIRRAIEENQKK